MPTAQLTPTLDATSTVDTKPTAEVIVTDRPEAATERAQPPPSPAPIDHGHRDPVGLGRSIIITATCMSTVVFVLCTAGLLWGGHSPGSSVGIGLFAAFWGGGGFGAMIGGVTYAYRLEQAAAIPLPVRTT